MKYLWRSFAVLVIILASLCFGAVDMFGAIRLAGIASVTTISANCYPVLSHPRRSIQWAKKEIARIKRKKTK